MLPVLWVFWTLISYACLICERHKQVTICAVFYTTCQNIILNEGPFSPNVEKHRAIRMLPVCLIHKEPLEDIEKSTRRKTCFIYACPNRQQCTFKDLLWVILYLMLEWANLHIGSLKWLPMPVRPNISVHAVRKCHPVTPCWIRSDEKGSSSLHFSEWTAHSLLLKNHSNSV